VDERPAWRMRQEAIRGVMDGLFEERPAELRALIRGLSSYEFEEAVLNAYDTMRGAGMGIESLTRFPAPEGVTVEDVEETLDAIRGETLAGWSAAQREHLEGALEAAERMIAANSTRASLEALAGFKVNLNKCKKGNGAYELMRRLKDQMGKVEYTLITEHYARERALLVEILRRFDRRYRERKRAAAALDYSDLEEFTVGLLEGNPEARGRLRRQFDHILMDEFQDTNGQQAKLIRHIRPPDRFYAVGDINQSIYGFRHAEPEGFERYREEVKAGGGRLVELEENFRSRADILRAVETITDGQRGIVRRRLLPAREFDDAPEFAVEALVAASPESEGRWIARRILEMSGRAFRDFAVLVRNTESIAAITAALDSANVPYVVNRGRGFYESREVNDLVHLLRTIANPRDEISLAVVLRSPLVGASDEDLLRLKMEGGSIGRGLQEASAPHLAAFRERLAEWRMRRESAGFDRLLAVALDEAGYPWSPNVDKFLAQARDAAAGMTLDEFVEELGLLRGENPREPEAPPEDSSDTVKIMTVHSAKGLEYKVVFVAALSKGVNNSTPVVGFSRRHGLGARWLNPATRGNKNDLFLHALHEEWKQRDEEESHRLLYVAMTRAEEHLVLSFSTSEKKPGNWSKVVAERLGLDPGTPRDAVERRQSPHGEEWTLRVRVAAGDPELLVRPPTEEQSRPAETVAAPATDEQFDANATVTALAKFAACPRQYYLGRYLGYEGRARRVEEPGEEEDRELAASELGTQVHALLAGAAVADAAPEAERLAAVFRRSELGRRAARAGRVERESDFLMAVGGLVVRGQIDLWFEEAGEVAIVDYKTDDVRAADAAARAADYALQLRLYAMAVERMAGRAPDRAYLHFLRPDRVVEIDLAPTLIESPEQVVREFQEAQAKLEFPLNEGERCRHCPFYKDLCPATPGGTEQEKESS
ncbi:MAG: UvrD-helicase domain-containing protein, partial [Acidobacteriota bacterium]|nr:UvrD-helicase domain-containing protein [Acidobacteriota bacterium]